MRLVTLLAPFAAGAIAAVALTPLVRALARSRGVVAQPKEDRWHRRTVALLGGVGMWGAVAALVIPFGGAGDRSTAIALAAGTTMFLVGLVDDVIHLRPNTKLIAQLAVAALVTYAGVNLAWTSAEPVNALITIFWIVGITNAFNLLDNMDGLCAGIAAIAAVALSVSAATPAAAALAALVAGAAAGFLVYNFNPASIFMGDSGSLFLGCTLAVLAVSVEQGQAGILTTLALPAAIMLIPIFDTTVVTLTRKLAARSASVGGRDHTSHRLVALGFSERQAVLVLYGLAALTAAAAVSLGRVRIPEASVLLAITVAGVLLLGVQLARVRVYDGEDFSVLRQKAYTPLVVRFMYKRRVFEVLLDVWLIVVAYYLAYILRFDREFTQFRPQFVRSLPIVIACQLVSFFIVGVYRGVWRYVSASDLTTYVKGVGLGILSTVVALVLLYRFELYSRGVFVIDAMALFLLIVGSRLSFRIVGELASRYERRSKQVLIYGAGDGGATLVRELRNNRSYDYQSVGFIDDDPLKLRTRILGVPVLGGLDDLRQLIAERDIDALIVSTDKVDPGRLARLEHICFEAGTTLLRLRFGLEPVRSIKSSPQ